MTGGGRSTTPAGTRPRSRVTSAETKEIIKFTQSRRELYPEIKSPENLKDNKYADLMKPLKKKPGAMPKYAKKFYDRLIKLEGYLQGVALNNFTYENAKRVAKPAEKPLFTSLENSINTITAANVSRVRGASTYLPRPKLNTLFAALSMTEFNSNLNNLNIVNQKFALDPTFKAAAANIMRHILQYRQAHTKQLKEETVYNYLDEIFAVGEDKIDETINKSKIINSAIITQSLRARIDKGWHEYQAYREQLEKRLKLEEIVNQEKKSILSKPVEYAKSGSRWIAKQIQKFRENWAGMDGKERVVAGATLLVGVAWFLNSDNPEAGKLRDALKKAGMLGILYIGANTTAKAFTGRTLTASLTNRLDDISGKRDLLKDSFNTGREGAEMLNASIAYLGNYDFKEVGSLYMDQYNKYKTHPIPDNLKELPIGGVAEEEMSSNQMYRAMRLVDRKLKKQGSSIEEIVLGLDIAREQAKAEGKVFIEPSYAMIISAILMNQDVKFKIKEGKIEMVKVRDFDVKWTQQDRNYTEGWWAYTGKPQEWKKQRAGVFPGKKVKLKNLKKISKDIMPGSRPLGNYITQERFGRYTQGFKNLYNLEIKNKPGQNVHTSVSTEGFGYMSSKVNINPNLTSKNMSYVAAIKSAYEQGVRSFENDLKKNNPALYRKLRGRIKEFIQPVGGVAIAPSKKKKGVATPTKKPQKYVLFLRYVLPNTQEFALRLAKEWPQGDMLSQMKESILKPGETLRRGDFNTIARTMVIKKKSLFSLPIYDGADSKFAGAYESFLASVGLKKTEKAKIDKILEFYSLKFANSGITKKGLIRYLATHQFTTAEIKEALGLDPSAPIKHYDYIVETVRYGTKLALPAGATVPSLFKQALRLAKNRKKIEREMFAKFGTVLILACYGDKAALAAIKQTDKKLFNSVISTFKFQMGKPTVSPTKTQFINGVLKHYMSGLTRALIDDNKRKKAKKAVGGYLSVY